MKSLSEIMRVGAERPQILQTEWAFTPHNYYWNLRNSFQQFYMIDGTSVICIYTFAISTNGYQPQESFKEQ